MSSNKIAIFGAGTIGGRLALSAGSLGYEILLVKRDGISKELQEFYNLHKGIPFKMYAAKDEENKVPLEKRIQNLNEAGYNCVGSTDDMPWKEIDLVIDATDNKNTVKKNVELYKLHKISFAVNGGAPNQVVKEYFVSVPNASNLENVGDSKLVSCNTTAVSLFLGNMLSVEELKNFRSAEISFNRRYEDSGKVGKVAPTFIDILRKDYHLEELDGLFPSLEPIKRISTYTSKWPTKHFHMLEAKIRFNKDISLNAIDELKQKLYESNRTLLVEDTLSQNDIVKYSKECQIPDADIPFPVYLIGQNKVDKDSITVHIATPQRSDVIPSITDYIQIRLGSTWKQAYENTNINATHYGKKLGELNKELQDLLMS